MSQTLYVGLLFTYAYSFYRDVARGIHRYAETESHWILVPVFLEGQRLRWYGKMPPDGLIATLNAAPLVNAATAWVRPLVNVSAVFRDLPRPRVAVDNGPVGRLVAEHFLERGLRNFAFLGHPDHMASAEREASFCAAVREAGWQVAIHHSPRDRPWNPFVGRWYFDQRVKHWLLTLTKPVGIFVATDILGAAITQVCRELELRVPDDIALVGVDNDDLYCSLAQPPLSSVVINGQQIGYEAAALLRRLLAGEKPPEGPILVPPGPIHTRRSSQVLAIADEEVAAAAQFIREHAHTPISVTDVLEFVLVSRRSLERRFQQALGRGLAQEICRVRLERSKFLLTETDLSMPTVAKRSGFSSTRHLAATFQRELGEAPSAYRRRTRVWDEPRR